MSKLSYRQTVFNSISSFGPSLTFRDYDFNPLAKHVEPVTTGHPKKRPVGTGPTRSLAIEVETWLHLDFGFEPSTVRRER